MRVAVVILPDAGWPEVQRRWLDAEQRGFAQSWPYDHLSWRSLRDGPWLGKVWRRPRWASQFKNR